MILYYTGKITKPFAAGSLDNTLGLWPFLANENNKLTFKYKQLTATGRGERAALYSLYENISFIEHIKGNMYKWEHKLHDSFNTRTHVC